MQKQHELYKPQLSLTPPEGADQPRLWVRRFAIWENASDDPIRDIPLRPGMNILWTPDDAGIGHGAGKTLFCRLLRYCLGENSYAPADQRDAIAERFPEGWVGVEVLLDSTCWAILRPLGKKRHHYAVPDSNLEALFSGEVSATGIEPFIDTLEQQILTAEVKSLIPSHRQNHQAWPIALAWLSRDQECRFDHVLDWRSSASDSDSPARGLNQSEKLLALRALLKFLTPEETELRNGLSADEEEIKALENEIEHRKWEIKRLSSQLITELGVSEDAFTEGPSVIDILKRSADDKLAKLTPAYHLADTTSFTQTREAYEAATKTLADIEQRIAVLEAQKAMSIRLLSTFEGELPVLNAAFVKAKSYPCPICEVPIDRALAEGCKLSRTIPDPDECRKRWSEKQDRVTQERESLESIIQELAQLKEPLKRAQDSLLKAKHDYRNSEKNRNINDRDLNQAIRTLENIDKLELLLREKNEREEQLTEINANKRAAKVRISVHIDAQQKVLGHLNDKFNPIIQKLINPDAAGEVKLNGKELNLTVRLGGNRSTSAIESLKIVAFDIASLCLSIEGKTRIPAFLIHDSPREADLGLLLYNKIFHLIFELENIGQQPLFQYIVTTTTRPPDEFRYKPWLAFTLRGFPASERLLKADL